MNMRPIVRVLSIFLLAAPCLALACARGGGSGASSPIQIGLAAPLTGPEAQTGQDMRDGALFAIEQANNAGGVAGRRLELVPRDDKADPKEAASVAHYLVSSPNVVAVVGHLNSDCSLATAGIYQQASMAMVTPVSTSDALTAKGYTNVFRIPIRNSAQGAAAADWVTKRAYRRIAVLDDGGAYGDGIASEFTKSMASPPRQKPGQIVLRERFNKDDTDFRPLLGKIKAAKANCVYFGGMYPAAALFMKQSREMGTDFDLVGGDGIFAPEFIRLAGEAADRAYMTFIAPLPTDLAAAPKFYSDFQHRFGHRPIVYSPLSFDAANVVIAALRAAPAISREAVRARLHARDFEVHGVSGTLHFDAAGDGSHVQPFFYGVKNGQFWLLVGS
jgi:branched-chain amino acid transport system substrate-binding protein